LQDGTLASIFDYWNTHTLGLQYVTDKHMKAGSPEFFEHIRAWMNPFKFPWIMQRIHREAEILRGMHLLEIGCGMGYDSLEFLRRGVKVTATDLTPNAVKMARKHFEIENVTAEDVRVESVLDLSFRDETFDAVWANGVVHATGNTPLALQEIRRVLKPGGRAIISHFYRKPSWMYALKLIPGVNIEFDREDPPVNDFLTESEIEEMFDGFEIIETVQEHHRLLPVCRAGIKAFLYNYGLKPLYNFLPEDFAKSIAYKYSVTALRR
jgi:ubiquinone/menaquinone biosynthesis C-methylase UbiE